MAELDTGVLPVGEGDRLVGMITDRDIAVRAVAQGKGPDATVRDVMTPEVRYCFEDESLDDVVRNMGENKVRRLPVMSRNKRLVGIVSLGDVALYGDSAQADAAVSAVSEPGGPGDQTG
jgi:CBS domain-containing protein